MTEQRVSRLREGLGNCRLPSCLSRGYLGPGSSRAPHSRDGLDHGESHEDGADGVVLAVVGQPADAIVAVAQDLDTQLVVPLGAGTGMRRGQGWGLEGGQGEPGCRTLTAASLSKLAKSWLSSFTSSWALQPEDNCVKPTMSANRMLRAKGVPIGSHRAYLPHQAAFLGLFCPLDEGQSGKVRGSF